MTGPRHWTDLGALRDGLSRAAGPAWPLYAETITLVHGTAPGWDEMCAGEAETRGWQAEPHEAAWFPGGPGTVMDRAAGHKRNALMVALGADVCAAGIMPCARPGCGTPRPHMSHGTADCLCRAVLAGIPLVPVRPGRP